MERPLFKIEDHTAFWTAETEDKLWRLSESENNEDYARSYRIRISPKDFLDLTTREGAESLNFGDYLPERVLKPLNIEEFNQESQPLFMQIAFKELINSEGAFVVRYEGRHRMFALWKAGIDLVDVELRCQGEGLYHTLYEEENPFKISEITLIGNPNVRVRVKICNLIPMSKRTHKHLN